MTCDQLHAMETITAKFVRERARGCCEYCRLRQEDERYLRFHIEHIIAKKHNGTEDVTNLALACGKCNRSKGTNLAGLDPSTGQMVALFHSRKQNWDDHFELQGADIIGRTSTGRATVHVLNMNTQDRLDLRALILHRNSR